MGAHAAALRQLPQRCFAAEDAKALAQQAAAAAVNELWEVTALLHAGTFRDAHQLLSQDLGQEQQQWHDYAKVPSRDPCGEGSVWDLRFDICGVCVWTDATRVSCWC